MALKSNQTYKPQILLLTMGQKQVFWQALLITILIFSIGVTAGVVLENWRTSKIASLYDLSELSLLDVKLQTEIYSLGEFNCEQAIQENIAFADRVYEEAKMLERYEGASRLTAQIEQEHKKYDLLRTMILLNSIKIKQGCPNRYYEIVYLYQYNDPSLETKAKQSVFSKLLIELKETKGDQILLIPVAADNNLASVNLLLEKYNIEKKDVPLILINRNKKITTLTTVDELRKYLE